MLVRAQATPSFLALSDSILLPISEGQARSNYVLPSRVSSPMLSGSLFPSLGGTLNQNLVARALGNSQFSTVRLSGAPSYLHWR